MRKISLVTIFFILILFIGCAGTGGGLKTLPEPQADKVMVCGNILIENIDAGVSFSYWDLALRVVILGRDNDGNIEHYETMTDREGYYCFPNLPKGSYIIKAIIFQRPGELPNIITNKWESYPGKYYMMLHPERGIDYSAQWFPQTSDDRIINMNIKWFGLQSARIAGMSRTEKGRVSLETIKEGFETRRMWRDGHMYTRQEPLEYIKGKFPGSKWFE